MGHAKCLFGGDRWRFVEHAGGALNIQRGFARAVMAPTGRRDNIAKPLRQSQARAHDIFKNAPIFMNEDFERIIMGEIGDQAIIGAVIDILRDKCAE